MGISKILRSPSVRTQFEASLTGIVSLLLASLGTTIYLVAFTEMSGWFKFLTIIGEIGLFLLMGSSLVGTYTQYYVFKKTMGLYPPDEELNMKLEEAKQVRDELNELIEKNNPIEEVDELTKLNLDNYVREELLKSEETKLETGGNKNV